MLLALLFNLYCNIYVFTYTYISGRGNLDGLDDDDLPMLVWMHNRISSGSASAAVVRCHNGSDRASGSEIKHTHEHLIVLPEDDDDDDDDDNDGNVFSQPLESAPLRVFKQTYFNVGMRLETASPFSLHIDSAGQASIKALNSPDGKYRAQCSSVNLKASPPDAHNA